MCSLSVSHVGASDGSQCEIPHITLLNAMHDFCCGADFRTRGIGVKRLETGWDGVRFCFKEPEQAEAFQARFGGELRPGVVRLRKG